VSIIDDRRLRGHVRIWNGDVPVGSGFVVGPRHVMTCAHVVGDSAGRRAQLRGLDQAPLELDVRIDMPLAPRRFATARIMPGKWRPESAVPAGEGLDDAVVLELCEGSRLPDGARTVGKARLVKDDDPIRGLGVSLQQPTGVVIRGTFQGLVSLNRFHILADAVDEAIRPGCSGAAAWNSARGGIAGMVVEMQQTLTGRVIPVEVLEEFWRFEWEDRLEGAIARRPAAPAARSQIVPRLKEELRSFDRVQQIGSFEGLLRRQWDVGKKPLVCTIAGLEPDKPEWCRDKCRHFGLDRRFQKLKIRADRVNMIPLTWPASADFDGPAALADLKNEVSAYLDPRNEDAVSFRQAYNAMLNPVVFYSNLDERVVRGGEAAHTGLLREWISFWAEVGGKPLKKPFVHFLLLKLAPAQPGRDPGAAELGAYRSFYERLLAGVGVDQKDSLPLLGFFTLDEVDLWLRDIAGDVRLGKAQLAMLRSEAEEMFRRNPDPRMADLAEWLEELEV
jgi:hypothetical protein